MLAGLNLGLNSVTQETTALLSLEYNGISILYSQNYGPLTQSPTNDNDINNT
jgi:hypothetical protein